MFIDIHNHILNGIDDGSDSLKTSIEMLKIAVDEDIKRIIATPHFIYGALNNTDEQIKGKLHRFQEEVAKKNIQIDMYPGSEVFISPETSYLVSDKTICRLNNSRYVLIELPMLSIPDYTQEILFQLQLQGYKPIIAHPERNKVFQQYPEQLHKLVANGMLAQVNASSLNRLYGKSIQKTAMKFVESKLVHFVATDAHTCRGRAPKMVKAYENIKENFGKETAQRLFVKNGMAVLNNSAIEQEEPEQVKRSFMSYFQRRYKSEPSY